jgi:hypothetical protein
MNSLKNENNNAIFEDLSPGTNKYGSQVDFTVLHLLNALSQAVP